MNRILFLLVFVLLLPTGHGADGINPGVPWPATDALGRELPLTAEVGPPKKDRFVGIFYLTWTGDEFSYGPYDISKILADQPDMQTTPTFRHTGPKEWHYAYWGEPLFGYYKLTDPWVIRRHMHMLADAGVDALVLDATNAEIYENVLNQFLPVLLRIRAEGGRVPQLLFMLNTDMGNAAKQLLEKFYRPGRYDELWFRWEGKPLMLCNPDAASPEVREYFTLRTAFWPGTPPYKNTPNAWHWESVYPQTYGFTQDPKVAEQMNVSPAQNMNWETGALELMHTGKARGRGFAKGKQDPSIEAIRQGRNFQEQWDQALKVDPKFVMITAWNEWVAGLTHSMKSPWVQCDSFNEEFSRDIEPMKGGFGDNFFYQAIANIRRYKGADHRVGWIVRPVEGSHPGVSGPCRQHDPARFRRIRAGPQDSDPRCASRFRGEWHHLEGAGRPAVYQHDGPEWSAGHESVSRPRIHLLLCADGKTDHSYLRSKLDDAPD
jgi:hypothetical protein